MKRTGRPPQPRASRRVAVRLTADELDLLALLGRTDSEALHRALELVRSSPKFPDARIGACDTRGEPDMYRRCSKCLMWVEQCQCSEPSSAIKSVTLPVTDDTPGFLYVPVEVIDAELRRLGVDPVALAQRGLDYVSKVKAEHPAPEPADGRRTHQPRDEQGAIMTTSIGRCDGCQTKTVLRTVRDTAGCETDQCGKCRGLDEDALDEEVHEHKCDSCSELADELVPVNNSDEMICESCSESASERRDTDRRMLRVARLCHE